MNSRLYAKKSLKSFKVASGGFRADAQFYLKGLTDINLFYKIAPK
jgi:hypothetical protein